MPKIARCHQDGDMSLALSLELKKRGGEGGEGGEDDIFCSREKKRS